MLDQFRTYYRSLRRPNGWMFPSLQLSRSGEPITDKVVWHACRQATRRAGITKAVHLHTHGPCIDSMELRWRRRSDAGFGFPPATRRYPNLTLSGRSRRPGHA